MKKVLSLILVASSISVFADDFQGFNNNLYAQYNYTNISGINGAYSNGYGLGGTLQSKENIWANINLTNQVLGGNQVVNSTNDVSYTVMNLRAGYAVQFFNDDDSGFQLIPYVAFGATNSANYQWGLGIQPEYRLLDSFKVALGLGLSGYNGNSMASVVNGGSSYGNATVFGFNINPEIQYDIAKTLMLSVGYNYTSTFNADQNASVNAVTAKVGYLF